MTTRFQSLSLYWRIFLMLLVAQIAIAGGAVGLTLLMHQVIGAPAADWNRLAAEAGKAYRDQGDDGFDAWRRQQMREGIMAFLIDRYGEPVIGTRMPPPLQRWALQVEGEGLQRRSGPPGISEEILVPVPADILPDHRLAAFVDTAKSVDRRPAITLTAIVVGAIGLIALVTLALTRSLLRPITDLRRVTNSMAAGEFSKRVGVGALSRKDEIGALAADFDTMADRIERQFDAQRQLLRDVSHELKSPLARLKLAIELVRDETDAGDAAGAGSGRWMARLEKEADALETMLDRILDLARAESGMQDQRRATFDLDPLLQSLVKDASFEALKKGMTVHYVSMTPARVTGVHSLLASAIENVIRNAIRYGEPNSQIAVTLAARNGQAQISVANQGASLRLSDLARIFDPFYRVPNGRADASGGQGIGLTITQKVMLAHNGGVTAENRSEGGLLVRMTLPLTADGTG